MPDLGSISGQLNLEQLLMLARAVLLLLVGIVLARVVGRTFERATEEHLDSHRLQVFRRLLSYGTVTLFLIAGLHELGFQLSVLLGAAGILTVALGFAAQTSATNIVSGLFLLGERPFSVGDVIRIGNTTGEVISIDLLSAKIRTFDNLFVRIPNETLMKSEITNLTRFPIRRHDMTFQLAYREDLARAQEVLIETADKNPLCLEEPRPLVIWTGYADSGVSVQLSVWASRENFLAVRNQVYIDLKTALHAEGIEIPFPQLVIHHDDPASEHRESLQDLS